MFLGMRGTGDWVTDQRPKSWREMILYLYPNGDAPLTAMMAMMSSESVTDPEFNWWTQTFEAISGAITGLYTDAALSVSYVSSGVVGTTLYMKMSAANIAKMRPGHQLILRYTVDSTVDVNVKVLAIQANGASSYATVKLLEADDNSSSYDLSDADRFIVVGNINPEGGEMPQALAKDPSKLYNYCQIFRTPLEITRTARKNKLRTGDAYQKMKSEALEMHSVEMEWNTFFSTMTEGTGDNGKPERTTMGIIPFVRTNASQNVSDFRYDSDYAGTTWLASGEAYIDKLMEILQRYANVEDMVWLCGSGAIAGINNLVKSAGAYQLESGTEAYGIKVTKWITPWGTINMKTHPLFSQETSTRYMMAGVTPKDMKFRYIDDTRFYAEGEQQNTGHGRIDGTKEEYLTEGGYEFQHPEKYMILDGIGKDNLV
jgi:hypothetical protein